MAIREAIVSLYRRNGEPLPLPRVAHAMGVSLDAMLRLLAEQQRFNDVARFELREAADLLDFYGPELMFEPAVVRRIREYLAVRAEIERLKRGLIRARRD